MSTYTPFEQEIITTIQSLRSEMKNGFEQVDNKLEQVDNKLDQVDQRVVGLETRMENLDVRMGNLDARMENIEDAIFDIREDIRNESTATRALLSRAFEHISDQMASADQSIQPSLIFRHSRSRTRTAV